MAIGNTLSARIERTPTKMAAVAILLLITLLSLSAAASAQEAPIAETPHKIGFWDTNILQSTTTLFSTTSECVLLYGGKCNIDGNVMFDCYADAQATCRCYVKSDTTNKCGGGTTPPPSGGGTTPTYTCQDSDGGVNLVQKGTTKLFLGTTEIDATADSCGSNLQTEIWESYCSGTSKKSSLYACPSGTTCNDGACKTTVVTGPCTGKADFTTIDKYCADNTAFKTTCIGGVARTAQQSCANLGRTCQNDECQVIQPPSDGGGAGGGAGGTGGGSGGQAVCCQQADGKLYVRNSAEECNQRGVGGILGKDPTVNVDIATCTGTTLPKTCAADEVKQADGTCKKKTPSGTFEVEVNSVPSLEGAISSASEGEALESLCLSNAMCESSNCEESRENRDAIDSVTPIGKFESSLGEVRNGGFEPLKTNQNILLVSSTEGTSKPFKEGTAIEGVCREKIEKFDFNKFFKDNQTAIFVGIGAILLLMFLPSILPRGS